VKNSYHVHIALDQHRRLMLLKVKTGSTLEALVAVAIEKYLRRAEGKRA
jgi:hypothetical protein